MKRYLRICKKMTARNPHGSTEVIEIEKEDANCVEQEINSHPSIKRNKIEARDDASLNQDAISEENDK